MFTNSIDAEIKKYAENNRTYNNNTSCMYPRNFRMCSFSIRGQSSKGGGHELLVKSDIGDTLNIGVVPNHWHLIIDHVHMRLFTIIIIITTHVQWRIVRMVLNH